MPDQGHSYSVVTWCETSDACDSPGVLKCLDPDPDHHHHHHSFALVTLVSQEIQKLTDDVKSKGLNLIVFAEWYHVESMLQMKFYDDNTRSWWTPVTGMCACQSTHPRKAADLLQDG